jgi:hypothetical protein
MDASFHGGSNDTIGVRKYCCLIVSTVLCSNDNFGGRGRLRRPWPTSAAVADFGGRGRLRRPAVENLIGGVVDTGKQLSAVSFTPAIKLFPGVVDTGH